MIRLLCVFVLAAAACGGRPSATAHPETTTPPPDAGSTAEAPAGTSSEACAQLIAHAVELGIAERPPEQKLTEDERAAIEAQLRGSLGARCTQLSRPAYDCAMAAQTLAAVQACAG